MENTNKQVAKNNNLGEGVTETQYKIVPAFEGVDSGLYRFQIIEDGIITEESGVYATKETCEEYAKLIIEEVE